MNAVPAEEMSANSQRRSSAGSQTQWALQAGVKGYAVIQHPDANKWVSLHLWSSSLRWIIIPLIWILFTYMLQWWYVSKQVSLYRTIKYYLTLSYMAESLKCSAADLVRSDWCIEGTCLLKICFVQQVKQIKFNCLCPLDSILNFSAEVSE